MDANPYAPPKAVVADHPGSAIGLKRRSIAMMLVFTIVTFGVYIPVWFFRRRAALNRLDSPTKVQLWPFVAFVSVIVLGLAVDVVSAPLPAALVIGRGPALLLSLARFAVAILTIVQYFRIKDILEDHIAGRGDEAGSVLFAAERVRLSGLMTFFFSIYYLQYVINRHIAVSK